MTTMTKELQELMLLQSAMWDVLRKKINSSIIPLPSFKKVDPAGAFLHRGKEVVVLQECAQDLLDLIAKSPVASEAHRQQYAALSTTTKLVCPPT